MPGLIHLTRLSLGGLAIGLLASGQLLAQPSNTPNDSLPDGNLPSENISENSLPSGSISDQTDTLAAEDGSWVSLRGTIVEQDENTLRLDYGEGTVTVEVDDWTDRARGELAMAGDEVTVYGQIDNDFYEERTLEASSIYIEDFDRVLSGASPQDEEGDPSQLRQSQYTRPSQYGIEVSGRVTSTEGRKFTIDTGERRLTVDTIHMPYNPLDDMGFQQIEEGDWVRASGQLGANDLEDREILAESVTSLQTAEPEIGEDPEPQEWPPR